MKKIYLHIGFHKTGSSSIQQSLLSLNHQDWKYITENPLTGNDSGPIQTAFNRTPWKLKHHRRHGLDELTSRDKARRQRIAYRRQIRQSTASNLLISAEDFCSLNDKEVQKVSKFFQGLDRQVIVVAYIRPVASFLQSAFQQRLKASSKLAINHAELRDGLKGILPKYTRIINRYRSAFGQENVRLFAFDPSSFPGKDTVIDFCLRLGIPVDYTTFVRTNDSLSMLAVKVLFILSRIQADISSDEVKKQHQSRSNLVKHLMCDFAGQPSFRISSALLREIIAPCEQEYQGLDSLIESYRDFSLVPSYANGNSDSESEAVSCFADLSTLTLSERASLIDACYQKAKPALDIQKWSDADLVKFYSTSLEP
jgi:hypothetical protein